MEKEIFNKKLAEKFLDESYSVIYYGKTSQENTIIKCLDCGRRIEVNTGELFRARRKHICSKCHYKRKDTQKNEDLIKARLLNKATNICFFMQDRNGIRHNMVNFTCNKCGRINTKEVANFLRQKYDCGYCKGQKESKDTDSFMSQLKEKFGNRFELLNEYQNVKTDVRIKCTRCGFIRNIKPNSLLQSGYCPKCDVKNSKGEKVILEYLKEKKYNFECQKYFSDWNIGIHYFDFYIPSKNLVIEYQGIQHYVFNPFFHKNEEDFEHRKEKDLLKKQKAIEFGLNYISIHYSLFPQLFSILNFIFNSTTIPEGSRGKCLEIETIQDLDEDIV